MKIGRCRSPTYDCSGTLGLPHKEASLHCPYCQHTSAKVRHHGWFHRCFDGHTYRVERFRCATCRRTFSTQTGTPTYREHKAEADETVFLLLRSGISQRRCALLARVNRKTVARKLVRLGGFAAKHLQAEAAQANVGATVQVDELETFEHSKCKPLSVALAVERGTRRIVAAQVAVMPAKGKLAAVSRQKYGKRPDHRAPALVHVLEEVRRASPNLQTLMSDKCPRYPALVARHLPGVRHERTKGRRGCVVGQGELKRGGKDPLFSLNHTCAMLRANINRLIRKTWCTTKVPERLAMHLAIYMEYHNFELL